MNMKKNYLKNIKKSMELFSFIDNTTYYTILIFAFFLQETLLQSKLKLFKVRETRKLDILAEGENSRDTLELHFDKMAWDEGIETGVLKK
jgi:hypothetical protein